MVGDEEAEDAETASSPSPSPSASAKPPPATTPESPAMQVQHMLIILQPPEKTTLVVRQNNSAENGQMCLIISSSACPAHVVLFGICCLFSYLKSFFLNQPRFLNNSLRDNTTTRTDASELGYLQIYLSICFSVHIKYIQYLV